MVKTVSAVYEDGILRPSEPLPLAEHQRVSVTVSDVSADRPEKADEASLKDRYLQEKLWLAENRQRFAGHWIALQGRTLLASGDTAKEVFSRVAGQVPPPLVIRVDDETHPFAGW